MDYPAIQAQFEQACMQFSRAGAGEFQARKAAELVLTQFRKAPNVLPVCKYILEWEGGETDEVAELHEGIILRSGRDDGRGLLLSHRPKLVFGCSEHTQKDEAKFHVAAALKEAGTREYSLHPKSEIHGLRDWLLEYVLTNFDRIPLYIRNSILLAVAVMVKRGWLEESPAEKEAFLGKVTGLLNGDAKQRQVALSLFSGMIDEFSSDKSSAVGLPYDFHVRSRQAFEEGELRHIFQVVVQVLQHLIQVGTRWDNPLDAELWGTCVQTVAKVLSWEFVAPGDNALQGSFERRPQMDARRLGRFPASWRDFIVRPDIIDMFFQLHHMLQENDRLADHTRECLRSLASVHGPVFHTIDANGMAVEDENAQRAYVAHFLKGFLQLLTNFLSTTTFDADTEFGPELSSITTISKFILQNNSITTISTIPTFFPFLNELGKLTITCYANAADEDEEYVVWTQEAGDDLLDVWAGVVEGVEEALEEQAALATTGQSGREGQVNVTELVGFLRGVSFVIFGAYVDMRLEIAKLSVDDVDVGEGMKDEYMYEDQLIGVSIIGRLDPVKSIAKLQTLLTERIAQVKEAFSGAVGFSRRSPADNGLEIGVLMEHIHWLALLSGHFLADAGRGEQPEIPRHLVNLSVHSPDNDPIVSLTTTVFNALEVVSVEPDSPQFAQCSPQVTESLLWFLERWSETYLFLRSTSHAPQSLVRAFGKEGGGPRVLEFVLGMVHRAVVCWCGEVDVLTQIVSLLNGLSKSGDVREALLNSEKFRELIALFLGNLSRLPTAVHSPLIETIATISSHAPTPTLRQHYFSTLSSAIEKRLVSIIHSPTFSTTYQSAETIELVLSTLEMYSGLALAADETNTKEIFGVVSRWFGAFVKLLEVYRMESEVEKYVLAVFGNLVRCQSFEELTPVDCQTLYEAVLELLKVYAKNEVGRKREYQPGQEEELFEDLSCILELLAQLMASQYEGLAWNDILEKRKTSAETNKVDVADIVFCGVNIVIPLVSEQMLKFPELCKDYISLVANLVRYFPDKLSSLPSPLITSLLRSLEFGMGNVMVEVARSAFEAVTSLSLYVWEQESQRSGGGENTQGEQEICKGLDNLLRCVLEMFLFREFDSGVMEGAGEALFGLVLARGGYYTAITTHLLSTQPPPFSSRLSNALQTLNNAIGQTASAPGAVEQLRVARVEGFIAGPGARWFGGYRGALEGFLMDVRGFLRVK